MMSVTFTDEQLARSTGWLGPLALSIPLLLGAGLLEESTQGPVLPPNETYRTPFSETLGNSGDWRQSISQGELEWRKPEDAESNWRNKSPQTREGPPPPGHVQVLPKYQYEKGTAFDFTKERAKDQINHLEFRF